MRRKLLNPMVLLALLSVPAAAHLPALYGSEFLRAGDSPDATTVGCMTSAPQSADPVPYHDHIAALEEEQGPYSAELAEPLSDLARHHRHSGDFEGALELYGRALHLVRVNDGLNSEQQLALLAEIADTYREQGNLQALDGVRQQQYRVQARGRSPRDPAVLAANLEFIAWQREAWSLGIDGNDQQRLLQAYLHNRQVLDALAVEDPAPGEHREALLSQLANLYLIMGIDLVESAAATVLTSSDVEPSQSGSRIYVRQRIARIQQGGIGEGRDILEQLLPLAGPENSEAYAAVQLEMGDWYQWNGEHRRAAEHYTGVIATLQAAGREDLVEQWLGAPAELPDNRRFQVHATDRPPLSPGAVTARFAVDTRGRVDNIEVLALPEDQPGHDGKVRRMLTGTHFRPRFASGSAETVAAVERSYRFIADVQAGVRPAASCLAGG